MNAIRSAHLKEVIAVRAAALDAPAPREGRGARDDDEEERKEALMETYRPVFEAMDEDESGLLEPAELRFPIGHAVERSIKLEVASHDGTEKEVRSTRQKRTKHIEASFHSLFPVCPSTCPEPILANRRFLFSHCEARP